jgi:hypothetical protein
VLSGIQSAKLKVDRAAVHIKAIQGAVDEYVSGQADLVSKQPDGTKKLRFASQPPPAIAILVGEVVYQLRSALDHLAFDLVNVNESRIQLPSNWMRNCQFPLLLEVPTTGTPPAPCALPLCYNFFKKSLPGISKNAFTFIEGLQPYYRGNGPTQLGWLEKLANIDKHRHLHIVNPQAYQSEYIRSSRFSSEAIVRLRDGAELKSALHTDEQLADAVHVESGIANPFVSFDESALDENTVDLPVDHILELCADTISTIVIPAFEKLIKNP